MGRSSTTFTDNLAEQPQLSTSWSPSKPSGSSTRIGNGDREQVGILSTRSRGSRGHVRSIIAYTRAHADIRWQDGYSIGSSFQLITFFKTTAEELVGLRTILDEALAEYSPRLTILAQPNPSNAKVESSDPRHSATNGINTNRSSGGFAGEIVQANEPLASCVQCLATYTLSGYFESQHGVLGDVADVITSHGGNIRVWNARPYQQNNQTGKYTTLQALIDFPSTLDLDDSRSRLCQAIRSGEIELSEGLHLNG